MSNVLPGDSSSPCCWCCQAGPRASYASSSQTLLEGKPAHCTSCSSAVPQLPYLQPCLSLQPSTHACFTGPPTATAATMHMPLPHHLSCYSCALLHPVSPSMAAQYLPPSAWQLTTTEPRMAAPSQHGGSYSWGYCFLPRPCRHLPLQLGLCAENSWGRLTVPQNLQQRKRGTSVRWRVSCMHCWYFCWQQCEQGLLRRDHRAHGACATAGASWFCLLGDHSLED